MVARKFNCVCGVKTILKKTISTSFWDVKIHTMLWLGEIYICLYIHGEKFSNPALLKMFNLFLNTEFNSYACFRTVAKLLSYRLTS